MNWTPFNEPIELRAKVSSFDDDNSSPNYITVDALAWRWDEDRKNVAYLTVRGTIWYGSQLGKTGVVSLWKG